MTTEADVTISLWGYKEDNIEPSKKKEEKNLLIGCLPASWLPNEKFHILHIYVSELLYITDLEKTTSNDGWVDINPIDFYDNDDGDELRSIQMGLIKINLTNPEQAIPGLRTSP